jgi:hypothetical protein
MGKSMRRRMSEPNTKTPKMRPNPIFPLVEKTFPGAPGTHFPRKPDSNANVIPPIG